MSGGLLLYIKFCILWDVLYFKSVCDCVSPEGRLGISVVSPVWNLRAFSFLAFVLLPSPVALILSYPFLLLAPGSFFPKTPFS